MNLSSEVSKVYHHLMSKKKIMVLQWLRGHYDMTGNEKALAKKDTLITKNRDHGQKDIKGPQSERY